MVTSPLARAEALVRRQAPLIEGDRRVAKIAPASRFPGVDEWERQARERHAEYRRDVAPLKEALVAAGVDPTDFGLFVNRPIPGILRPSRFDGVAAMPILLDWLPRVTNEDVKRNIVWHLKIKEAKVVAVDALIVEFLKTQTPHFKWIIADVISYLCDRRHFGQLVRLAADPGHSMGRAPLVAILWRVKTPEADEVIVGALSDPDTARSAMSAARRRFGNEAARPMIEQLLSHPHEYIGPAAKDHLRRIDKQS